MIEKWRLLHKILFFKKLFIAKLGFNTPRLAAIKMEFSSERYPAACGGVVHFFSD
jgi:hypothetical protein